tara:strand:+ start:5173 stop:5802 length:630 start_codon:yes stop_codon:yes gene_type:complete
MSQYQSGEYINEFLNQMPTLLLTMRKMDVDQMLQTRKLDQQDRVINLDAQRFAFDSTMRDRQMNIMEAEAGRAGELFAEEKKGRQAWRKVKEPLTQAMKQRMQLDEEYRKQKEDMPFKHWWRPNEESWQIFGKDIIKSERQIAKDIAEEKYGKPKEASEVFGDVESISKDLSPEQFMSIYSNPYFQPQMLGKTGLMGLASAPMAGGYYP